MLTTRSRSRGRKFAVILVLIFGLPLLALGRITWTLVHTPQSTQKVQQVSAQNGNTFSLPTGSDWPTYLHDPQRTASTNETILSTANVSNLTKLWSFKTNGAIAASAMIVAGKVYVGSWDGYEYALDQASGTLIWKRFLGQTLAPNCNPPRLGVTSAATIANNVLYVGGGDAYWYALDANTGAVLWRVYTGDNTPTGGHYNWSSPLLYNGYAYIGIASNCDRPLVQGGIMQVSLAAHKIVNFFKDVPDGRVGGGVWSSPSIDPATNSLFIASGTESGNNQQLSQSLYVLDATTMQLKSYWHLPEKDAIGDSDFDTSPILFSEVNGPPLVAVVNKNGYIYVFNRNDLTAGPLWQQKIDIAGMCPVCEQSSVSSNAFGGGRLYVAAGNTQIGTVDYRGSVDALDPRTGKFLWRHAVNGAVIGSLVYVNGLIIDGAGPTLEVLDASTGKRLYSYTTGGAIFASPSVAHGMIFESSTDGRIYALGLSQTAISSANDKGCPSTWLCQDIGIPVISGAEQRAGNTWNIQAGGVGISSFSDQFHFTAQKVSGNVQISAKVLSEQAVGVGTAPQAGLMVRQSSDAASPNYAILLVPGQGIVVQYRTGFGTQTVKNVQLPRSSAPLYLEIQRSEDIFQAAISTDGISYTLVPGSDQVVPMPLQVEVGFAVSSANSVTHAKAVYDELAIGAPTTQPTPPGSTAPCPTSWTCSDVGNPALIGSQALANGNWTIQGGGTDIWWSQTDQFHFVSRPVTGDASLSACVVSQKGSTPYLKSGLMIRQSLDANSIYYAVSVEPDSGPHGVLVVESRTHAGILSQPILTIDNPTHICMKIVRAKNVYTAYTSSDDKTWTLIPNSTGLGVELPATALVGMTVTAKDPQAMNTTVFANAQLT